MGLVNTISNIIGSSKVSGLAYPLNFTATVISTGVRLTWTSSAVAETEIWFDLGNTGTFSLLTLLNVNVSTYDDLRSPGTTISYKLRFKYVDSSTFDTASWAFFDRITAASASMTYAKKVLLDTYIRAQKTNGLWDKTYAEWWVREGNIIGRMNLHSSSYTLTDAGNTSGFVWTTGDNFHGNSGIAGALDTGFNPTTVGLDKNSTGYHWHSKTNNVTGDMLGGHGLSPSAFLYTEQGYILINDGAGVAITPNADFSGHNCLERSASNRVDLYHAGSSVKNYTTASTNQLNINVYLSGFNNNGVVTSPTNNQFTHFAITTKFTLTEHANFITNKDNYLNG